MRQGIAWAVLAVLALAWAAPAFACPVCYGEASGEVIDGTRWSIAFLGGLVYLVLFGGAGMVLVARRRALAHSDPHHGLHLVSRAAADAGEGGNHHQDDARRPGTPAGGEETSER